MTEPEESTPTDASSSKPHEARPGAGERKAIPWGQRAELELHATSTALSVSALPEGEKPYLVTHGAVDAVVREHGSVTRVELVNRDRGFLSFLWGDPVRVELFVPANLRARLSLGAGAVNLTGLKDCELELTTHAGTAVLRDVHGRLALRAGAGSLVGERVGGTLNVETAAGTVRLEVDSLAPGEHHIASQLGSVELRLEKGLDVRIEASTTLGAVRTRYPSNPQAASTLRLHTELGAVRVREARKGRRHSEAEHDEDASDWHDAHWERKAERWARRAEAQAHRWSHRWGAPPWEESRSEPPSSRGPTTAGIPDEELRRVLQLVQDGKVSVEDAEKLLRAMQR